MTEPLYALRGLRKVYQGPAEEVVVLKGLDFEIPAERYPARSLRRAVKWFKDNW